MTTETMNPESPFNPKNWENMPWTGEQVESIAMRLNAFHSSIINGTAEPAIDGSIVIDPRPDWANLPEIHRAAWSAVAILIMSGSIADDVRAFFLQEEREQGQEGNHESRRLTGQFLLWLKASGMDSKFIKQIDDEAGRFVDDTTNRTFTAYVNGYLYGRNYQFGSDREFTARMIEEAKRVESLSPA